jgi:hypothetical protein
MKIGGFMLFSKAVVIIIIIIIIIIILFLLYGLDDRMIGVRF